MRFSLTRAHQTILEETIRVLASPLVYEGEEDWLTEVVKHTRTCLGGVVCSIQLPRDRDVPLFGADLSDQQVAAYREYEPFLREADHFGRLGRRRVATRRDAFGPHYEAVTQSAYTQEFMRSIGCGESLSLAVPLVPRPRRQRDLVQLLLNKEFGVPPFDEEAVRKARLLYPAFEVGIRALERYERSRNDTRFMLDHSGGANAVYRRDGLLLHLTPTLDDLLGSEPKREELMDRIRRLAASLGSVAQRDSSGGRMSETGSPQDRFSGRCGIYVLTATEVRGLDRDPSILVTVSPPKRPELPPVAALQHRFGLTPQQARVARMLARRRTNKEIADALCISVHTARHHVQHTLEKLEVPRRAVRERLGPSDRSR